MSESKSIFIDLEIDLDNFVSQPDEFQAQVMNKADELAEILNSNNSLRTAEAEAIKRANENPEAQQIATQFLQTYVDQIEVEVYTKDRFNSDELYHLHQRVEELSKSIKTAFESAARAEMMHSLPNVMDKALAHRQYTELRQAHETWRNFMRLMHDKNYPPMKPKSGNYTGGSKRTYPAFRIEGQEYFNHRAVAFKMGWNPDDYKTPQDIIDKLEQENITDVQLIETTL